MRLIKCVSVAIFSVGFTISASAQVASPKYSNEFLSIGVGARSLGMSNSQVAISEDVTAGYWNPAGLISLKHKYEVAYMHSEYFGGIAKYDYAAVATQLDSTSSLAISYIRFGVDDIPDTRFLFDNNGVLNYDNVKYFSATDNAFLLSYAKRNFKVTGLSVGANFKIIYRNVGSFANAWGFGLDAGAKYNYKKIALGVVVRDVTSTYNFWSVNSSILNVNNVQLNTGNSVPGNSIELTLPRLILAGGYRFKFSEKIGLLTALDLNTTFDGKRNTLIKSKLASIDPSLGLEADYVKKIYIRAGVGNIQKVNKEFTTKQQLTINPNFGIGVKLNRFSIDYALTTLLGTLSSNSLYSNVISIKIGI